MSGTLESVGSAVLSFFGVVIGGSSGTQVNPNVPFGNMYAFGDSLSDTGNLFTLTLRTVPVSPPYFQGHFTNGPVWVQDLAASIGLPAVTPSLQGGTDFAYGGAETGNEPLHSANPIDLPSQLQQFKSQYPDPNPSALYTVWAGSNDVLDAISEWSSNPTTAITDLADSVNNTANFIFGLAAHGAHNLLVLNVPNLGKTPEERQQGKHQVKVAAALSKLYDADLSQTMQAVAAQAHLNLITLDTRSLIDKAVKHPAQFGISDTKHPVWTGNFVSASSGTLASTNPVIQNQHLFWDQLHPTAQGHAVVANDAYHTLFG